MRGDDYEGWTWFKEAVLLDVEQVIGFDVRSAHPAKTLEALEGIEL